jgi:Fe-S-cluster-containing dehydrogenase component/DMSO reductase anchor subunit
MSRPQSVAMIDAEVALSNLPAIDGAKHDSSSRPASGSNSNGSSLIERFLEDQRQLTAVERFARVHDAGAPVQARRYSTLMPTSPPQSGEQYAFEVDLDACSGCKSCVTACHTLNGLDDNEAWRDVGMLHGGPVDLPVIQHVTAACHHCLDPACMNVCPVKAYEKDAATGIVRHLDDQCIGCQYCMLACPYDVPKYNHRLGIVRKCDMCAGRLAAGEAPACVEACPNEAIRITVVRQQEVIENCETSQFLPGAPDPAVTLPTTHYKTRRVYPRNMLPADYYSVRPEHAHWPLVVMLVLTQLSVGAFLVGLALQSLARPEVLADITHVNAISALVFGLLAMGAAVFHLGRPLYAFRAIIGLGTSWLSREIVAFGAFAALAAAYAVILWNAPRFASLERVVGTGVVICGLFGVACSIMIYQCTNRSFWSGSSTSLKFLLTMIMLGLGSALVASLVAAFGLESLTARQVMTEYGGTLAQWLVAATGVKLLFESLFLRHGRAKQNTPSKRSAMLMTGELRRVTGARFGCGLLGGMLLPGLLWMDSVSAAASFTGVGIASLAIIAFSLCVTGELLERYLFFTAVVPPRMPGRLRT